MHVGSNAGPVPVVVGLVFALDHAPSQLARGKTAGHDSRHVAVAYLIRKIGEISDAASLSASRSAQVSKLSFRLTGVRTTDVISSRKLKAREKILSSQRKCQGSETILA